MDYLYIIISCLALFVAAVDAIGISIVAKKVSQLEDKHNKAVTAVNDTIDTVNNHSDIINDIQDTLTGPGYEDQEDEDEVFTINVGNDKYFS